MKQRRRPNEAEPKQRQEVTVQISIPMENGIASTATTSSLIKTANYLTERGIGYNIICPMGDNYTDLLNEISSKFYVDRTSSHLLIADPYVFFDPDVLLDVIEKRASVVNVETPKRTVELAEIYAAIRSRSDRNPGSHEHVSRFAQERASFILIERLVFEKIANAKLAPKNSVVVLDEHDIFRTSGSEFIYGFFSPILDEGSQRQLVNFDALFRRWALAAGGRVQIVDDLEIGVVGLLYSKARFSDRSRIS